MQVSRSAAVSAMTALQFGAADKWSDDRMLAKLKTLNKLVDDDTKIDGTADDNQLISDILEAIEAKEDIELVDDGAEAPVKKKTTKANKKPPVDEEVEVAEDDAEEEPETPPKKKGPKAMKKPAASKKASPAKEAPAKTKPTAKAEPKERKEGVIGYIIKTLMAASEDKPISKKQIGVKLQKHFPDKAYSEKPSGGMHITLTVQVPHRLTVDRYLDIQGDSETGYWLPSNKDGTPRTTKKR